MVGEHRVIKKYQNRRLYDTAISAYITLADVKQMVIEYCDVQVVDAKTGEDLTRQVLLQLLIEEEAGGSPILSNEILTQMIRMYGQALQSVFGPFLEQNMRIFRDWQRSVEEQAKNMQNASKWLSPFRQNFAQPGQTFMDWQRSLQQQTIQFWQNVGCMPKDK